MKILIINQHISDSLGGSELQCHLLASGLINKGHEIIYAATGKNKNKYCNYNYTIIPLNLKKSGELLKLLKKEKPNIIYWRYDKNFLRKAVSECKFYGIPFVFAVSHVNNIKMLSYSKPNKNFLINIVIIIFKIYKSIYNHTAFKNIDAVTLLNGKFKGKLPAKNQKVIYNSVPTEYQEFNWSNDFCVWVANIKSAKQPEKYIKIANKMKSILPNIDFLMIGAIQDKKYIKIIKKAEQDNFNFHYLGFKNLSYVNGVIKKAKCLVHTCKPEGFGNNFIQAWMHGCPTISLEFDPDDLIVNKNLGFISGNTSNAVNDIKNLITNKNLRLQISNNCLNFSQNIFTQKRMVDEIEKFLIDIIVKNKKI